MGGVVDFVGRVVREVGVRFDAALIGVRGGGGGHFGSDFLLGISMGSGNGYRRCGRGG